MKVMQICAYAAPYEGNFIKSLKSLEIELNKYGYETIYVFPENAKSIDWCKQLEKKNFVYYLPLSKARVKLKTYLMLKKIFEYHPDIMVAHSHFELYDIPVTFIAPKTVKVFWHLHDAISNYKDFKNKIIHKIQYCFLQNNSVLLSVSEKHMEYVNKLGFSSNRMLFIPNGLDLNRVEMVKTRYENRKYDFLMFGWEYERKGVDLCIEASNFLGNKYKIGIIVSDRSKLQIYNNHNHLENIELVNPVKDINTIFKETKCFLHISRAEGLSYALLEAMYAGLDVVCSDIPENNFAKIFPTVKMVEKENIPMIANVMNDIMNSGCKKLSDVEKTRDLIESKYSIETWVESIKKVYGIIDD